MTLHVERIGSGPDVVLLHGWGLHGGAWRDVASRLARRFRVHVVDLPGHGHSPPDPFDSLASLADRVAPAVPSGSVVAGWSLGSLVAMQLARQAGIGVRALGLVSATPSFVTREGWPAGLPPDVLAGFARDLARDREATVRAFLHLVARGASAVREGVRRLDALVAERPEADGACLAAGLRVLATADLRDALPSLSPPAAVIHGDADALVPPEAGRRLAQSLPSASFTGIEGAGHAPLLTHPDDVARALESLHG